jgi:hypothetical protein
MTLTQAGIDLSVANADWPAAKVAPKVKTGLLIETNLSTHKATSTDGKTWVI